MAKKMYEQVRERIAVLLAEKQNYIAMLSDELREVERKLATTQGAVASLEGVLAELDKVDCVVTATVTENAQYEGMCRLCGRRLDSCLCPFV